MARGTHGPRLAQSCSLSDPVTAANGAAIKVHASLPSEAVSCACSWQCALTQRAARLRCHSATVEVAVHGRSVSWTSYISHRHGYKITCHCAPSAALRLCASDLRASHRLTTCPSPRRSASPPRRPRPRLSRSVRRWRMSCCRRCWRCASRRVPHPSPRPNKTRQSSLASAQVRRSTRMTHR